VIIMDKISEEIKKWNWMNTEMKKELVDKE
jgi:hypothetical protein